jgi:protein-L-isoaspartate(D-aspartate) O-methyltransferase
MSDGMSRLTPLHRPRPVRATLLALISILSQRPAAAMDEAAYAVARAAMVDEQIAARGIQDPQVLAALRAVPRHRFVPASQRHNAYQDFPLPIGRGQTISQPYIVALMTQHVRPQAGDRALEVGTGSGYQAAVLAQLVQHVYTIELEDSLARSAAATLRELNYDNVTVRSGDGYGGWPEHAPFDIIIVTAAADHVPQPLLDQLEPGGRLIIPVGPVFATQHLQLIEKDSAGKLRRSDISVVRFVPLRRERGR